MVFTQIFVHFQTPLVHIHRKHLGQPSSVECPSSAPSMTCERVAGLSISRCPLRRGGTIWVAHSLLSLKSKKRAAKKKKKKGAPALRLCRGVTSGNSNLKSCRPFVSNRTFVSKFRGWFGSERKRSTRHISVQAYVHGPCRVEQCLDGASCLGGLENGGQVPLSILPLLSDVRKPLREIWHSREVLEDFGEFSFGSPKKNSQGVGDVGGWNQ